MKLLSWVKLVLETKIECRGYLPECDSREQSSSSILPPHQSRWTGYPLLLAHRHHHHHLSPQFDLLANLSWQLILLHRPLVVDALRCRTRLRSPRLACFHLWANTITTVVDGATLVRYHCRLELNQQHRLPSVTTTEASATESRLASAPPRSNHGLQTYHLGR